MSDCILFAGHIRSDGCGIISRTRNRKTRILLVHRWVWAEAHGIDPWNLPSWVRIKHTCELNACVNPDHLYTDVDDDVVALLPPALPPVQPAHSGPDIPTRKLTPAALRQASKKLCTAGHAFRDAPDDTRCTSCRVNKTMSAQYEAESA